MTQAIKLFCFAISVLLFLQLSDATDSKKSPGEDDTESNVKDGEEQRPVLLKNFDKIKNSVPVKMVKNLSNIAEKQLSTFSKDFETSLKSESKKHVKDENSIIPNIVTHNVIIPAKALAQTGVNTLREPVGNILSSFTEKYDEELTKSEQDKNYVPLIGPYTKIANKPVAFLKASKDIAGNTFGSIFGKASSIWNSAKNNKAETTNEKSEK